MSLKVEEITNFKSGIDLTLDPILSPSEAFINLRNGYVHRGVLHSRKGLRGFATGTNPDNRIVSRLANDVTNEAADTGDGGTDYSFTLANTQVKRRVITVNAPIEALTITFTYDADTKTTVVTGDTGGGTNSINYQTGAMSLSFSGAIAGGNAINVTYEYHPDLAVMGIHEYFQTPTPRDLVVCDRNFPYQYNGATNDFDRIAFEAGVGPFSGNTSSFFTFNNWRLHSRGAVPAAAGSLELSDVLFMTNNTDAPFVYDGTNVDLVSNMIQFREPPEGSLDAALHVLSFGERLIWLRPTLGGEVFGQGVLWGPVNDSSGLALDYQGTGSGLLSADTNSIITGFHLLRDTLIVFFEKDVFALEITDDAFQPFRWRRLEDERGVEPTHATTGYLGTVESPGQLQILGTDGRRVKRVDDKIPFFARDRFDPLLIRHMFGEEMEEDSQFWWTFPDIETETLSTSNKVLVKNFEEENYSIYDLPISVLNKTIQGDNTVWDNLTESFAGTGDGVVDDADPPVPITSFPNPKADVIWDLWGLQEQRYKTLIGDHHGFIQTVGKSFNDGYVQVSPTTSGGTAINLNATATIQTESHHFHVGDRVLVQNVSGMVEINGQEANVLSVPNRNSITVDIDSTNYTAWSSGGEVVKLIEFEVEFVPFNPLRSTGQSTYIGKMDFLVTSGTGEYEIDFFEDRSWDTWTEPTNTYSFNSAADDRLDRWFSIYVDNKADFHRWRIRQQEDVEQVVIKSIRVFYKEAGESNV